MARRRTRRGSVCWRGRRPWKGYIELLHDQLCSRFRVDKLTEEEILKHNGLLCKSAQVTLAQTTIVLLDPRPCQVDIKQQQQHSQANNRRL